MVIRVTYSTALTVKELEKDPDEVVHGVYRQHELNQLRDKGYIVENVEEMTTYPRPTFRAIVRRKNDIERLLNNMPEV